MEPEYKIVITAEELHKAFCVRSIVFVDGQCCPYAEEFDGLDLSATHFLGLYGDEPFATARIRFVKGAVKIERLAVREQFRGNGTGRRFLQFIMEYVTSLENTRIILHAQSHLTGFYESFGFIKKGEPFFEAGIHHYFMETSIG
ncbi:MAG: GNAT family N-acetyltransferase [Alistipes sp.]|nr:GNAT family N-acetyltransferase [Alistipes sp.]